MSNATELFPQLDFWGDAENELNNLDGHQKKIVYKALQRIQENGATIGEALSKKRNVDLTGYRKVKLKAIGIRIVYKVLNGQIEVAEIIAIGDRADEEVYKEAAKRIEKMQQQLSNK